MNAGDVKNFIYMPEIGLIEAGSTPADAVERINRAEAKHELEVKKLFRKARKLYPNQQIVITKEKNKWYVLTL